MRRSLIWSWVGKWKQRRRFQVFDRDKRGKVSLPKGEMDRGSSAVIRSAGAAADGVELA